MRILHLTLRKKPFDLIAAGIKKEEYRGTKMYWYDRLMDYELRERNSFTVIKHYYQYKKWDAVMFKNGYAADAPSILVEFKGIDIGPAVPEWADGMKGEFFRIHLGEIIETNNIK